MTTETTAAPAAATTAADATGATAAPDAGAVVTETTAAAAPPAVDGKPGGGEVAAEGAPQAYAAFTMPDGAEFGAEVVAEIGALAKNLNLPQAQAQKVVDVAARAVTAAAKAQQDTVRALHAEWEGQVKADKEFGGEKLAENLARAKAALQATATPQLQVLLEKSGLMNHPDVVRHFLAIAPAVLADTVVPGGKAPGGGAESIAQRMYPTMKP